MDFPSCAIRGGKRLFGNRLNHNQIQRWCFPFRFFVSNVPSAAPPGVLTRAGGGGDPVPPTHNKGRKKGEREQLGFKGCKCSVPLRASLLSSGIPVFTHHSKAVAPQPSIALLAEHPHCHLLGAHLWNTATKGAVSSNGPSGGQKGLRKASS